MALESQLQKLEKLLNVMDQDGMTKAEFVKSFEQVVALVIKVQQKNDEAITEMQKMLQDMTQEYQMQTTANFEEMKKKAMDYCTAEMDKMMKDHEKMMTAMDEKMDSVQDGQDADETKIVQDVLAQIKPPEQKEVILDGPKEIRDKLESLKGEDRLDKEAIRGLEEEIKSLKLMIVKMGTTRGTISGARQSRYEKFSFSGDGATTAFTLSSEPAGKGLALWAYYQGQWLQPGTHFTLAGKTFTTTFTAASGTTIEGFLEVFI